MHNSKCPYTLQLLDTVDGASSYLIRENDRFGEFPNIFAKVYFEYETHRPTVIILSDSGTGLDCPNQCGDDAAVRTGHTEQLRLEPQRWNIASFLEATINPGHNAPYILLTTHCHYDHICGIEHLLEARVKLTILSSSHDKSYLVPWKNLQKHSLCGLNGLKAPEYDAQWIEDAQKICYIDETSHERKQSSITVIHTPGHTPDSISWYDSALNSLCVGDLFYERESDETRSGSNGQWLAEPPQPIVFTRDGNIVDWNSSMHRLLDFVRSENRRLGATQELSSSRFGYRQDGLGTAVDHTESPLVNEEWSLISTRPTRRRVALCAAHVTIATDAEFAILDMLAFMLRIQLDQVPRKKTSDSEGNNDSWLWEDQTSCGALQYSVKAPWSVIHKGSSFISPQTAPAIERSNTTSFRSMIRHMTTPLASPSKPFYLKSNALASVSHNSVMASRPAVNTPSKPGKE